jgi:hypothetical protein
VVALVFLALGILLTLIGRIMLISAAFGVSIWWGLGIFLPFGPLLFRMNYPDLAPLSRTFRLFALPCFLAFFVLRPTAISGSHTDNFFKHKDVPAAPANHYGMEKVSKTIAAPSLQQRRIDNAKEMERLSAWGESLHLTKRDLLRSDVHGNITYNAQVAEYNAALAKATTERNAIWPQTPPAAPAKKK